MKPFERLDAVAGAIDQPNVDTDQLLPARFMRKPREQGYGRYLFYDSRFQSDGTPNPSFVLNQAPFDRSKILVVDQNFGCGSSREQAVWALVDFGICCIIGASFGDIFFNNAVNHSLLLITQPPAMCESMRRQIKTEPGIRIKVDLVDQVFQIGDNKIQRFNVEASRKRRLLEGLDEIGLTLQYGEQIQAFEQQFRARHPWLFN